VPLSQGPWHGVLVTGFSSQRCCHRDLVKGTLSRGPCHRVVAIGSSSQGLGHRDFCQGTFCRSDLGTGTSSHGPCRRDLSIGSSSRGPNHRDAIGTSTQGSCHGLLCHRDLATGTLPQGSCHRDLATGSLPQGSCHRDLVRRDIVTGLLSQRRRHGDLVAGASAQEPRDRDLITGFLPQRRGGRVWRRLETRIHRRCSWNLRRGPRCGERFGDLGHCLGPLNRDLATTTGSCQRAPCQRDPPSHRPLARGPRLWNSYQRDPIRSQRAFPRTVPRGPRRRVLVTGTWSWATCLGDLAMWSLSRRPCRRARVVKTFTGSRHWPSSEGPCPRDPVTGASSKGPFKMTLSRKTRCGKCA